MSSPRQAAAADAPIAGAAALDKAFALVDRIAAASAPPTAAELGAATGLPRSTLFRLLSALEARGYVRRDKRERGWRLGFRLFELAQGAWTGFDLHDAAEGEIASLPDSPAKPCSSQRSTVPTRRRWRRGRHAGDPARRRPRATHAHGTTARAVSRWSRSPKAACEARLLAALPERTRRRLEASLELTRGRGYAVGTDGADGVADLAAPVLDVRGNAAAALALAGPAYRLDDRRLHALAPVLMAAARRVSHNAGGTTWSLTPAPCPGPPTRGLRIIDAADALLGEAPYWSSRDGALYWVDMLRPALHRLRCGRRVRLRAWRVRPCRVVAVASFSPCPPDFIASTATTMHRRRCSRIPKPDAPTSATTTRNAIRADASSSERSIPPGRAGSRQSLAHRCERIGDATRRGLHDGEWTRLEPRWNDALLRRLGSADRVRVRLRARHRKLSRAARVRYVSQTT